MSSEGPKVKHPVGWNQWTDKEATGRFQTKKKTAEAERKRKREEKEQLKKAKEEQK